MDPSSKAPSGQSLSSQHLEGGNLIWCCQIPLVSINTEPQDSSLELQVPCSALSDGDLEIFLMECSCLSHPSALCPCRGDKCPQPWLVLLSTGVSVSSRTGPFSLLLYLPGAALGVSKHPKTLGESPKEVMRVRNIWRSQGVAEGSGFVQLEQRTEGRAPAGWSWIWDGF